MQHSYQVFVAKDCYLFNEVFQKYFSYFVKFIVSPYIKSRKVPIKYMHILFQHKNQDTAL